MLPSPTPGRGGGPSPKSWWRFGRGHSGGPHPNLYSAAILLGRFRHPVAFITEAGLFFSGKHLPAFVKM